MDLEDLFWKMVMIIPTDACKSLLPSSAPICHYSLTYITNLCKKTEKHAWFQAPEIYALLGFYAA